MSLTFVALVGPTASGKTDLAIEAVKASAVDAEIIVLDSRQLYRGLDVGTGKPDAKQQRLVPHHLLDCVELEQTPDAMEYRRRVEVTRGLPRIRVRRRRPRHYSRSQCPARRK
jgi:tRNA dimethylallyltransferase